MGDAVVVKMSYESSDGCQKTLRGRTDMMWRGSLFGLFKWEGMQPKVTGPFRTLWSLYLLGCLAVLESSRIPEDNLKSLALALSI